MCDHSFLVSSTIESPLGVQYVRLLALAGRLAVAGIVVMGSVTVLLQALTDGYGYHLCGWPARITCDGPVLIWWLVPLWFGVVSLAGTAGQIAWALTGDHLSRAWPFTAWAVVFPFLVISVGPRQITLFDLWFLAVYASGGIVLTRAAGLAWFGHRRLVINRLAALIAALLAAVTLLLPLLVAS